MRGAGLGESLFTFFLENTNEVQNLVRVSIFTIISPAKRLGSMGKTASMPEATIPVFESEAREIASILAKKSVSQLMDLMGISKDLAELNQDRYAKFPRSLKNSPATEAILQFQGDVFQGLELEKYGAREIRYLKDQLSILSGMYGILRPFDKMHPYRLEMGTRLKVEDRKNLYQFWGSKITDEINQRIQDGKCKTLLNLASDEYARSVDMGSIQATVAAVEFLEFRNGKCKVVSTNAKRARGIMLNWILKNRPGTISALKKFNVGYEFADEVADGRGVHRLVFHKRSE